MLLPRGLSVKFIGSKAKSFFMKIKQIINKLFIILYNFIKKILKIFMPGLFLKIQILINASEKLEVLEIENDLLKERIYELEKILKETA